MSWTASFGVGSLFPCENGNWSKLQPADQVFQGSPLHFENVPILWNLRGPEGQPRGNCLLLLNKGGEDRVLGKRSPSEKKPLKTGPQIPSFQSLCAHIGLGIRGLGSGSLAPHLVQGEQGLHKWFQFVFVKSRLLCFRIP